MKTCPICQAKTFDDARICFGCLHDFSKPVADPLMPDLSREASSYLSDAERRGLFGMRRPEPPKAETPVAPQVESPSAPEEFQLPWDEDPEHPTKTMSAEEWAECEKARAAETPEDDSYEIAFALQWVDGSVAIQFEGDYETEIFSPNRAVAQPIPGLGINLVFDPPSSDEQTDGVTCVSMKASPVTQVSFAQMARP